MPIGFLMLWSYRGLRSGQRWAYVMNWIFSLPVLATPFAIGVLMTGSEFRSPAFAVAAVLMGVVGIVSCAVLLWARAEFASQSRDSAAGCSQADNAYRSINGNPNH